MIPFVPNTAQEIRKLLEKYGFELQSYRPGTRRLYQVVKRVKGTAIEEISPYMEFKELKAWVQGFLVGLEPESYVTIK